jgi:hypothetical protein
MFAHRFLVDYFLPYYLCFIVLSMFRETFRKVSSLVTKTHDRLMHGRPIELIVDNSRAI